MIASSPRWTDPVLTAAGWRRAQASTSRAALSPRRVRRRSSPEWAVWAPEQTKPGMTVADVCRLFADDRRLVRVKLLLLAGLVIATAVLERVM